MSLFPPNAPSSRRDTLEVLYRDDLLVAVSKPAGLLVHRSDLDRHETRFALQVVRDMVGRHVYPVHRLDRPTSGVLLFALTPEAARTVMAAFEERRVEKRYLAVVRGVIDGEGTVDHPLVEEPDQRMPGALLRPEPQDAVTAYRRLAQVEIPVAVGRHASARYSLVELHPHTGRRRQLRRHMKHLSHPIIGDTTYGDGSHNRLYRDDLGCRRMLLHAAELSFPHPESGETVVVTAPLDPAFGEIVDRFGWRDAVPSPQGRGELGTLSGERDRVRVGSL
jgi:tRNA pseudouridine65 synthase